MVQIITPTRLMPGGLRFVDSNIAVDRMNTQAGVRRANNADDRAQKEQGYRDEDRVTEKEDDRREADAIVEAYNPPPTEAPVPSAAPPVSRPAAAPERAQGIAGVSSAIAPAQAAPPPAVMPQAGSGPDVIGVTDGYETDTVAPAVAPLAAPPAGGMEEIKVAAERPQTLQRVKSTDPYTEFQRSLAQRHAKAGRGGKAVAAHTAALQGDIKNEDEDYRRDIEILDLLDAGKPDQALLRSQQRGVQIPREVRENGEIRRVIRTTADYAKDRGALHDDPWKQKFTETLIQTGSEQKALAAAGTPKAKPSAFRPLGYVMSPTGDMYSRDTGAVKKGVGTPRAGGGGARPPAKVAMAEWLVENKVAKTRAEAWDRVNAAVTNPRLMEIEKNKTASRLLERSMDNGIRNETIRRRDQLLKEGKKAEAEALREVDIAQEIADEIWGSADVETPTGQDFSDPDLNAYDPDREMGESDTGDDTEQVTWVKNDEGVEAYYLGDDDHILYVPETPGEVNAARDKRYSEVD